MSSGPSQTRLPEHFAVRLSPHTHLCDDGTALVGGAGGTLLRLRGPALGRVSRHGALDAGDPVGSRLCRLLLDRGYADPWWAAAAGPDADVTDVTVVVPVLDRPEQLARLLETLPTQVPVVVVDDGSRARDAVADVARQYAARLVVHARNRGPSAARNSGLGEVATPFVVFCDSDVTPLPGWLAELRRQFEDPALGIAGPRVRGHQAEPTDGWLDRYEQARSSLDLGGAPALVRPGAVVSYLPGAALMARVEALGRGFDEDLRVAEDVDLVWRTVAAGWRARYVPASVVRHEHRTRLAPWLARKAYYGTGAALLAQRHGDAVAPIVVAPWSAVLSGALLAQRPASVPVAAAALAFTTARIARRFEGREGPLRGAVLITAQGARATVRQTSSALTRHYWPVAVLLAIGSRRARRALLLAGLVDGLLDRRRSGADLDPVRYLLAHRLDDLAYGTGLWWGAVRARSARALLPAVRGLGRSS